MDRIKIALNLKKPGNHAFFCPVSRLHLTRSNPVGHVDRVTSAILIGLTYKTLLDVNGVVDLKTGNLKEKATDNNEEKIKTDNITPDTSVNTPEGQNTKENVEPKEEQVKEKESDSEASISVTEETPKKRGRKANK